MKCYAGNANSLADNIIEILKDDKLSEKLKNNASKKVQDSYNWEKITEKTIDVYNKIIEETNKSNWQLPKVKDLMKDFSGLKMTDTEKLY